MKKIVGILCASLILCAGCANGNKQQTYSGTIEAREYDVYSQILGQVTDVKFNEGDTIKNGDIIAVVDNSEALINEMQAKSKVNLEQAKLDDLTKGTRPEVIAQARANLEASTANLDNLKAGTPINDIKQAEAAVAASEANLNDLKSGNRTQKIEQAHSAVNEAQSIMDNAKKNYDFVSNTLTNAKILYKAGTVPKNELDSDQNAYENASTTLQTAKDKLSSAKSAYSLLQSGATNDAIKAAQAIVDQGRSKVLSLKAGATPDTIKAGEAAVRQAQAALDYDMNGQSETVIAQAQAGLDMAKSALDFQKLQVAKYQIKSPVDGVFLYKNIEAGQLVSIGTNIATVQSTTDYWIKIYLPQTENGKVSLNEKCKITAVNNTNEQINGTVVFISPTAEYTPKNIETTKKKQDDTVFEVKIKINDNFDKIKAGMNTYVELGA